jgi:hypothetical protein
VDVNGMITKVAGNGTTGFSGDGGPATSAALYTPFGVAVDGDGNIYITDQVNTRIRKVDAGGRISTLAGTGSASYSGDGGAATSASLDNPLGVAVDNDGNLYIADEANGRIRKVDVTTSAALAFATTQVFNTSTDSPQSVTFENIGNQGLNGGFSIAPNSFAQVSGSGTPADCLGGFSLPPGVSCNLSVSFTPQTGGSILGAVTFTDRALYANPLATQTITLRGTATVPQTIIFNINAPASAPYSSSFTVAAAGGADGNPVIFTSSGACTNVGTTYTMTAATGTCLVIASQAGNPPYLAAPQVTQAVNATLGIQTITFTTNPHCASGRKLLRIYYNARILRCGA